MELLGSGWSRGYVMWAITCYLVGVAQSFPADGLEAQVSGLHMGCDL